MNDTATETRSAAGAKGRFRMLHTMVRVKDLEKSLDFYTRLLGMKVLRKKDFPGGKFTLAFVGYGEESETAVLELTHNWDQEGPYDLGSGYGHIAIGVPDIYATCEALEKAGAKIPRPPGPMKHGTTVIAFVEDPDGYKIELIERA
jgi:lactoylglutathione lyase